MSDIRSGQDDVIEKMKRSRLATPNAEVREHILNAATIAWQHAVESETPSSWKDMLRPILAAAAALVVMVFGSELIADLTLAPWRIPPCPPQMDATLPLERSSDLPDSLIRQRLTLHQYRCEVTGTDLASAMETRQRCLFELFQKDTATQGMPTIPQDEHRSQARPILRGATAWTSSEGKGVLS